MQLVYYMDSLKILRISKCKLLWAISWSCYLRLTIFGLWTSAKKYTSLRNRWLPQFPTVLWSEAERVRPEFGLIYFSRGKWRIVVSKSNLSVVNDICFLKTFFVNIENKSILIIFRFKTLIKLAFWFYLYAEHPSNMEYPNS